MQLYFENRLKALALQKSAGINPYPHKFHVSMTILEYLEKYECLSNGDHLEDVQVSLAGINSINLSLCKILLSISVMFLYNKSLLCLSFTRTNHEQEIIVIKVVLL